MAEYLFIIALVLIGIVAVVTLFLVIHNHKHDSRLLHEFQNSNAEKRDRIYSKMVEKYQNQEDKTSALVLDVIEFIHFLYKKNILQEEDWKYYCSIFQQYTKMTNEGEKE